MSEAAGSALFGGVLGLLIVNRSMGIIDSSLATMRRMHSMRPGVPASTQ
jgi:hypothetical protein